MPSRGVVIQFIAGACIGTSEEQVFSQIERMRCARAAAHAGRSGGRARRRRAVFGSAVARGARRAAVARAHDDLRGCSRSRWRPSCVCSRPSTSRSCAHSCARCSAKSVGRGSRSARSPSCSSCRPNARRSSCANLRRMARCDVGRSRCAMIPPAANFRRSCRACVCNRGSPVFSSADDALPEPIELMPLEVQLTDSLVPVAQQKAALNRIARAHAKK